MKSYFQFLTESAADYTNAKNMNHDDLGNFLTDGKLNHDHVRGALANPHAASVGAVKTLSARSGELDHKSVGLLAMHAMEEKDPTTRHQLAYHLVNSGRLNETGLKHVATHALNASPTGHDSHLAKKILRGASDKASMTKHIESLTGLAT